MPDSGQTTERLLGSLISKVDGISNSLREFKEETARDNRDFKEAISREIREVRSEHQSRLNDHGGRIKALESDRDRREGGAKALAGLLSAAVAVGTVLGTALSAFIGKLWP